MGVMDELNALDEKAGVPRPFSEKRWHQSTQLWSATLFAAALWVVITAISPNWFAVLYGALSLFLAFSAGFFYNERLRLLGRRSRIPALRRPE